MSGHFAYKMGVQQLELRERGEIGVMRKERSTGVEPSRNFFEGHALYFDYKCDQRPFCTRILLERYEKVATVESKQKMFVACKQ